MAITFVGAACAFTTASTNTTLAVSLPPSSASNLLLVGLAARNNGAPTLSAPAGWTQIGATLGAGAWHEALWYRVATGLETSTCTFTVSANNSMVGVAAAFAGVDTTTPIFSSGSQDNGTTANASLPMISPAIINTELVYFNVSSNSQTTTADAATALCLDVQSTGGNTISGNLATELFTSSGASSVRVEVLSNSAQNGSWTVALAPSGAPGTGGPLVDLQVQLSGSTGAWTNIVNDTLAHPGIVLDYGIKGNGANDRVAATGTMSFVLNNSLSNSAGKLGYYTPGNANARAGFELGIGARCAVTYGNVTYYKFTGRLELISPVPGIYMSRLTSCTAVDWMDEAARHYLNRIPTQFAQRADQLIATVIGNMTRVPAASTLATAQKEYPYSLDTGLDESTTALTELQRIAQTDRGYIVIRGDQKQGGTLQFYDRRQRMHGVTASLFLSASTILETDMQAMNLPRQRTQVLNRIRTTAHPRIVDPALTTVLYRFTGAQAIPANTAAIFQGNYTDPAMRAQRVAAACMLAPACIVDYTFGTTASDTSLTGKLAVAASFGSNSLRLSACNTSDTQAGILNFIQARGAGIYDYSPVTNDSLDLTSSGCFGKSFTNFDLPYENSLTVASAIGDYEISTWKNPRYAVDSVAFTGGNACLITAGLQREPGDLIGLTESLAGFSTSEFFIQSVRMEITGKSLPRFNWLLQERFEFTHFWVLNISKLAETSADSGSAYSTIAL